MKVLIAGFDLFGAVGGGQTYYQNTIRRNPSIEFHYFRFHEAKDQSRPSNARAIDYRDWHDGTHWEGRFDLQVPEWAFGIYLPAQNMARSVAGESFDIVEIPDYYQFGFFLRPALEYFGVNFGRIVLSMHGTISTSVLLNWWANGESIPWLQNLERMQYEAVDQRYFISEFYRDEWRTYSSQASHYLDPLRFFDVPEPSSYRPQTTRPVLRFIGRVEKRKGPDLAVNLAWWLPRTTYDRLELIGPECRNDRNESAAPILEEMIRARGISARLLPSQSQEELARGFADRSVTLVPSIYDSLNLVALESLFAGCPTVIGSGAGVCRYLRDRFPDVPYIRFDIEQFHTSTTKVESLLNDYEKHRGALASALARIDVTPAGPTLADIYRSPPSRDDAIAKVADRWHADLTRMLRDPAKPNVRVAA